MRRVVALSVLLCACGLTARGSREPDGGDTPADAALTDGGAAADVAVDAEIDAGPCEVVVEDAFSNTTFDPAIWLPTANLTNAAFGYPRPDFTGATPTAKFFDDVTDDVRAAIWHTNVVPFEAFDVSFESVVTCTASCGDGLAIAWLQEATTAELQNATEGATFGMPRGLAGAAVAVDLTAHAERGETVAPAVLVLDVNGTDPTTPYDWVVDTSGEMQGLKNTGGRRIDIRMRAKTITVKVDGAEVASSAVSNLPAKGRFGFTAASGKFNAHIAVGDVRAKFYCGSAP
jgi:hypothetical protein